MIRRRAGPRIYTLLDAAALVTTTQLDLSDHENAPDFVTMSFYKVFGYPDLGALIVRKASAGVLRRRRCFYGGTVDMVIAIDRAWHALRDGPLHDRLEDGTLPFHNIIALGHAIDTHTRLYGNMSNISRHTAALTRHMYGRLSSLKHTNGRAVCRIYNDPAATYGDARTQGATITFNVIAADGTPVGYADVEKLADTRRIAIRSGSLCNPGGFATYLGWTGQEMGLAYDAGHRCSDVTQVVYGKLTGVVRASLGAMSNLDDVQRFLQFLEEFYVDLPTSAAAATAMSTEPVLREQYVTVPATIADAESEASTPMSDVFSQTSDDVEPMSPISEVGVATMPTRTVKRQKSEEPTLQPEANVANGKVAVASVAGPRKLGMGHRIKNMWRAGWSAPRTAMTGVRASIVRVR